MWFYLILDDILLRWTLTFERKEYGKTCAIENIHQNYTCRDEIRLWAQIIHIIVHSIASASKRAYEQFVFEDNYHLHCEPLQLLHLNSDYETWTNILHELQFLTTWDHFWCNPMVEHVHKVGSAHNNFACTS